MICQLLAAAETEERKTVRQDANRIYLQLLGNSFLYSTGYEHFFGSKLALGAGICFVPNEDLTVAPNINTKFYFLNASFSPYLISHCTIIYYMNSNILGIIAFGARAGIEKQTKSGLYIALDFGTVYIIDPNTAGDDDEFNSYGLKPWGAFTLGWRLNNNKYSRIGNKDENKSTACKVKETT